MIKTRLNQRITNFQLIVNELYEEHRWSNRQQFPIQMSLKTSDINKGKLDQHLQYHYLDKRKLYLNILIN